MDIKQTKRTLRGLPPKHSIFLRGKRGLGKSEIVAQTAAEMSVLLNRPFFLVDIRLGQYEVGDLIGIPRTRKTYTVTHLIYNKGSLESKEVVAEDVTVHDLPLWFPTDPDSCGYLFFDELDRSSRDVQQWVMQICLDYICNFRPLPIGWRVVAAGNGNPDIYNVALLCPALLDRFCVIDFEPTVPEWLSHAKEIHCHLAIYKYISKFGARSLDIPDVELPGERYQSRRSWIKLSNTIIFMAGNGDDPLKDLDYLLLLVKGYVGSTEAQNFTEYIRKDYKVYTAEDILNKFQDLKTEFKAMIATDLTFYNKELVLHITKNKLVKTQQDNLWGYVQVVPREVAAGLWSELLTECKEEATNWYRSSPAIKKYLINLLAK